jgi:hypothetical protein
MPLVCSPGACFYRPAGNPGGTALQVYLLAMALVNPKNPTRPLCLLDIRAMIARGEADIDAGRVSDLDELLAEWEAEDEAERRARVRGKPSAA